MQDKQKPEGCGAWAQERLKHEMAGGWALRTVSRFFLASFTRASTTSASAVSLCVLRIYGQWRSSHMCPGPKGTALNQAFKTSFFQKSKYTQALCCNCRPKNTIVKVLQSICQQIWKTQQWPQDWKRSVFIPVPKKGNAKECSNYRTIALISQASKVMLKILPSQASTVCKPWNSRCSSWIYKRERNQRSNCRYPLDHRKSKRVPKNHLLLLYSLCQSLWLCGSQQTVENSFFFLKIFKEMGIPDHLTCLLRNLYAGQEATFRTGHGTTDWFQIGKGIRQGCILSPCLFNLYAGYIMWKAGWSTSWNQDCQEKYQ